MRIFNTICPSLYKELIFAEVFATICEQHPLTVDNVLESWAALDEDCDAEALAKKFKLFCTIYSKYKPFVWYKGSVPELIQKLPDASARLLLNLTNEKSCAPKYRIARRQSLDTENNTWDIVQEESAVCEEVNFAELPVEEWMLIYK